MTIFQPATPYSGSIVRPPCARCGAITLLARIEPTDRPDHDLRTFECAKCQHSEAVVVKYR